MKIAPAESDADIARCFAVMVQLRPHLVATEFVARIRRMLGEGFHLAFLEDDGGTIRAVAGYRYWNKLFAGKALYVDDLVTDTAARSCGHGGRLLAWLAQEAKRHECAQLELDSGVQRFDAHRFYFRERMHISSYHFSRSLTA